MKRFLTILVSIIICLSLVACGTENRPGEAKTPETSIEMQGKEFMDVVSAFTNNGFLNVKAEPMEDLSADQMNDYGKVARVLVDGDEDYLSGEWLPYTTEVIIYYHSTPIPEQTENNDVTGTTTNSSETTTGSETESQESEKDEGKGNGFWDWLNKDVPEFEFEINDDGKSYTLTEYNYLSPDASDKAVVPATHEGLPVTHIASQAFYACDALTSVELPEGIIEIGSYAFYHCGKMESITFPASLRRIKEYAFEGCDSLTSVKIPWAINVGFRAFCECENLKTIELGNSDEGTAFIDGYAFYQCKKLENAKIEGATTIGSHAFTSCESLKSVTVSEELWKIEDSAFEFCRALETFYFNCKREDLGDISYGHWWNKDTGNYEEVFLQ